MELMESMESRTLMLDKAIQHLPVQLMFTIVPLKTGMWRDRCAGLA